MWFINSFHGDQIWLPEMVDCIYGDATESFMRTYSLNEGSIIVACRMRSMSYQWNRTLNKGSCPSLHAQMIPDGGRIGAAYSDGVGPRMENYAHRLRIDHRARCLFHRKRSTR